MWCASVERTRPGASLANSASLRCRVEMISRLDVCVICPSESDLHRSAASLPWVLWGEFPTLIGTMRRLRLLIRPPAALRCLRLAVPYVVPSSRPPGRHPRVVDPGPFVRRRPHRLSRKERMSPPRFLDDPFVYMPCSLTPVGSTDPTHSARTLLSSAFPNTSTPHFQLSRLCHTACTPPVYASQPRSPWYHATLGSGGGSALPVRDLHPTGHNERFPVVSFLDTLSSSPRLCLAHRKR